MKIHCTGQKAMLILLLVACFFINTVFASCPADYTWNSGIGICYKIYARGNLRNRVDAAKQCASDGAKLVTIQNAFVNGVFAAQSQNRSIPLWIGLKCDQNSTCSRDDGTDYEDGTYDNFLPGNPNPSVGLCTLITTNGRWQSADCSTVSIGFACEYDSAKLCDGYSFYNGKCYMAHSSDISITNPEEYCISQGGHLASILDQSENDFIQSLIANTGVNAMIGLFTNSTTSFEFYWTDGTVFNKSSYSNFSVLDPTKGFCISMLGSDQNLGFKGSWVTSRCEVNQPFICKRAVVVAPLDQSKRSIISLK